MHNRKPKPKQTIQIVHNPLFLEIAHPFLQNTQEYYTIRRKLNKEKQTILKDAIMTNRLFPHKPLYLFLTGRAGTSKTFIEKLLYEALIHLYDKQLHSDPLKPKGIIVAST